MNVLHIVSWYTKYGVENLQEGSFHYDQVLSQRQIINSALYFPFDNTISKKFNFEIEKNIPIYRVRLSKIKPVRYIEHFIFFNRIVKDFHPDILHAHVALGVGKVAVLLSKLFRIPLVISEHNPIELIHPEIKQNWNISNYVYKNSLISFCVSDYQKQKLSEFFPSANFITLYNGVFDPNIYLNDNTNKVFVKNTSHINFCIVASFYDKEIKGYHFLLPAMKELIKKDFSITLHICGGGKYLDYYKNLAIELNIQKNLNFYGQLPKESVYEVISKCDFLISCSLFESAGITIEEAFLLGKPVLVTNSGGPDYFIRPNNSVQIEKGSINSILEGISTIIDKLDYFDENQIKKYGYENFEINSIVLKTVNFYQSILKNL